MTILPLPRDSRRDIFSGQLIVMTGNKESPDFTLLVEGLWQLTWLPQAELHQKQIMNKFASNIQQVPRMLLEEL